MSGLLDYRALPAAAGFSVGTITPVKAYGRRLTLAVRGDSGRWELVGSDATAATETAMLQKGVKANDADDDSDALQEAINVIESAGGIWSPPPGLSLRISKPLNIRVGAMAYHWNRMKLRCDQMTDGMAAMRITGNPKAPFNHHSASAVFEGLTLQGPLTGPKVNGIELGAADDSTVAVGQTAFRDVVLYGFYDQLTILNNVYIQQFTNLQCVYGMHRGLMVIGGGNTGESLNFIGGEFSSTRNPDDVAGIDDDVFGIDVPETAAGPTLNFWGTSNSFCTNGHRIRSGLANFTNCHFESRSMKPHGQYGYVGGKAGTVINISRSKIVHAVEKMLEEVYEDPEGRPTFFLVDPACGDRFAINLTESLYQGYGKRNTELVTYTGNARPQIHIERNNMEQKGNAIGRICDRTDRLAGHRWLDYGTGATAQKFKEVSVTPGQNVIFRAEIADPALVPSVWFYSATGDVRDKLDMKPSPDATPDSTTRAAAFLVPHGCVKARIAVLAAGHQGVINLQSWVN